MYYTKPRVNVGQGITKLLSDKIIVTGRSAYCKMGGINPHVIEILTEFADDRPSFISFQITDKIHGTEDVIRIEFFLMSWKDLLDTGTVSGVTFNYV